MSEVSDNLVRTGRLKRIWWLPVLLAIVLPLGGLFPSGYVLDDKFLYRDHPQVQKGFWGIGQILKEDVFVHFFRAYGKEPHLDRYRPLSLVTFALEVEFFGRPDPADPTNPTPWQASVSRLINLLLHGLIVWLTLLVVRRLSGSDWIAWFAALLFAVHPLHTEVVANIKGRDELLSLLFVLLTLHAATGRRIWLAGLWVFLAMLAKEYAVVLLVFLPMVWWVRPLPRTRTLQALTSLGLGFVGYLVMRGRAVGFDGGSGGEPAILNNPYIGLGFFESLATRVELAGLYLWRMLVPHPLGYDHAFLQFPLRTWASPGVWLALLAFGALSVVGLWMLARRRPAALSLLFLLGFLAPVCGLLADIGTPFSDRVATHASLGACWALAAFGVWAFDRKPPLRTPLLGLCGIVVLLLGARSAWRAVEWRTEDSLFLADARGIDYSPVVLNNAAFVHMRAKDFATGRELADRAVKIHPEFVDGLLNRSLGALEAGGTNDLELAARDLDEAKRILPGNPNLARFRQSVGYAMMQRARTQLASDPRAAYDELVRANEFAPNDPTILALINQARAQKGQLVIPKDDKARGLTLLAEAKSVGRTDPAAALKLLEEAAGLIPDHAEITFYLGGAHFQLDQFDKAVPLLREARRLDPAFARWDAFPGK